jgi:hypothetical protein
MEWKKSLAGRETQMRQFNRVISPESLTKSVYAFHYPVIS